MDDFLEFVLIIDDDDDDVYADQVNDYWLQVESHDSLSQETKDKVYELCTKLVSERSHRKRKEIIREIENLTN